MMRGGPWKRSAKLPPTPFREPVRSYWIQDFSKQDDAIQLTASIRDAIRSHFGKTRTVQFSFQDSEGKIRLFFRSHEQDVIDFMVEKKFVVE